MLVVKIQIVNTDNGKNKWYATSATLTHQAASIVAPQISGVFIPATGNKSILNEKIQIASNPSQNMGMVWKNSPKTVEPYSNFPPLLHAIILPRLIPRA